MLVLMLEAAVQVMLLDLRRCLQHLWYESEQEVDSTSRREVGPSGALAEEGPQVSRHRESLVRRGSGPSKFCARWAVNLLSVSRAKEATSALDP